MLTGKAKTDYQREYMKRRRSNKPVALDPSITPIVEPDVGDIEVLDPVRPVVRPEVDADGNPIYEEE